MHGPGRHQDLLLVSAGRVPLLRQLFLPGRNLAEQVYSSGLPYPGWVGARCCSVRCPWLGSTDIADLAGAAAGRLRFRLAVAPRLGAWEPVGTLRIGDRLPDSVAVALPFNVDDNTGGGLAPVGLVHSLRRSAYGRSQAVRA